VIVLESAGAAVRQSPFPMRAVLLLSAAVLAGCAPSRAADLRNEIGLLHSDDPAARAGAFGRLVREPSNVGAALISGVAEGYARGFPVAAVLVARGEAAAVPLEVKVLHLALFEWPAAPETAILEPVVRHSLERDLARAGRPALRLLARALERDAVSESRALDLLRIMIDLAAPLGRVGLDEVARLLESGRAFNGGTESLRVCDLAGAALLHLGLQDALLAEAVAASDIAGEARAWWNSSGDLDSDHWLREGAARAVDVLGRAADPAPWVAYLGMVLGRPLSSEREARALWSAVRNLGAQDWARDSLGLPAAPRERGPWLVRILKEFPADRFRAWPANRLLEAEYGVRLQPTPPLARLADLVQVRTDWRPDPHLGRRWERWTESRSLRLAAWRVGRVRGEDAGGVLWSAERFFHAVEDPMIGGSWRNGSGVEEILHLQARRMGTVLLGSSYVGDRGTTEERPVEPEEPFLLFATDSMTCAVVKIEEPARPAPPPGQLQGEAATFLRGSFVRSPAEKCGRIARALAYLQDRTAAGLIEAKVRRLQESAAPDREALLALAEALILLDAPAGLDLSEAIAAEPRLTAVEREILNRSSREPRVRAWLGPGR
jgi:hypothetical protein